MRSSLASFPGAAARRTPLGALGLMLPAVVHPEPLLGRFAHPRLDGGRQPLGNLLDVALWVRDALTTLKTTGFAKTSGAGGLHVYVPMPPGTSYDSGFLFAQIVATMVANQHPKQATVERSIKARGRRIYVDYMQNVLGKTLASAYSARASEFAGVSTPLTWDEVEEGVSPRDFTIASFDQRMKAAGDPWRGLRTARGPDLKTVLTTKVAKNAKK